jgi:hypothetical protein
VLVVADGRVQQKTVTLGTRGEARLDAAREGVIEIVDGVAAGATLLRGTVGTLREGTPVRLPVTSAAAASAAR